MTTIQKEILKIAKSYLDHTDDLIYSYAGKTFFSGYDLHDDFYNHRGNIDCSTYMHLVLQGIPYEKSPYQSQDISSALTPLTSWAQTEFLEHLQKDDEKRRAHGIAKHYYENGDTFTDIAALQPCDLVFYQAPLESIKFYKQHHCFMEISHIGMVAENTDYIYHSTGLPEKSDTEKEGLKAIQYTHILDGRVPVLFARPRWEKQSL